MRVTVTELRNQLGKYLRLVKQGETIEVLERSVPIARLQRITGAGVEGDELLERLVRDGVVTPASKGPALALLRRPPVPCAADAVAVLRERRGDR